MLGDGHGNAIHLGERDCSLQRRHQKVWEEGPSPALNAEMREQHRRASCAKAMQELGYLGAGTIEFLYEDGEFYFIEMNTRIQVEHPVTEMITGIDLVNEQIRVAAGAPLSVRAGGRRRSRATPSSAGSTPSTRRPSGPRPGMITYFHPPGRPRRARRFGRLPGLPIPPHYDSLVGKLIVHGRTRNECLMRLRRALDEFVVDGVDTTLPLFRTLVRNPDIQNGDYDIHWLEQFLKTGGIGEE